MDDPPPLSLLISLSSNPCFFNTSFEDTVQLESFHTAKQTIVDQSYFKSNSKKKLSKIT